MKFSSKLYYVTMGIICHLGRKQMPELNTLTISLLTIFVLACFVGYYVVWKVTPALHTPLMSVTNAISSIIVLGALIAAGAEGSGISEYLGFGGVILASVNIF